MSESSNLSPRNVILSVQRAILERDVEGFVDHFHADAVLEFPHSEEAALPRRIQGRDAIRGVVAELQHRFHGDGGRLHGLENLVVHETTDPEVVVVEFEALGDAADGGYRMPDIQVWRVRDGRVLSVRDYLAAPTTPSARLPLLDRIPGSSAWG